MARKQLLRVRSPRYTGCYEAERDLCSGWDFFTGADPTSGNVQYVDKNTAFSENLAYVQSDGTASIDVDTTSTVPVGGQRKS
jgi:hypothetical protein